MLIGGLPTESVDRRGYPLRVLIGWVYPTESMAWWVSHLKSVDRGGIPTLRVLIVWVYPTESINGWVYPTESINGWVSHLTDSVDRVGIPP